MIESNKLEWVQKVAFRLIYGRIISYTKLLQIAKLDTLAKRREKLCLNFAKEEAQHPKFRHWFKQINPEQLLTRAKYAESMSRLKILLYSPIPYFTKLLNRNNGH